MWDTRGSTTTAHRSHWGVVLPVALRGTLLIVRPLFVGVDIVREALIYFAQDLLEMVDDPHQYSAASQHRYKSRRK
jgi:hypothetical protein